MNKLWKGLLVGASVALASCVGSSAKIVSSDSGTSIAQARVQSASSERMRLAVSSFEMRSGPAVGAALADFLTTALFNSGEFIVLERARLNAVREEQALQSGADFNPETRVERSALEGADIVVRGAVVSFQESCKGVSVLLAGSGTACVTLNLRLVDVATGRILNATTVEATSTSNQVGFFFAKGALPVGLGAYSKTPMETAMRNAIELAVQHIVNNAH